MDNQITRLDLLLSRIQLLDPPYQGSAEGKQLYQEICQLMLVETLGEKGTFYISTSFLDRPLGLRLAPIQAQPPYEKPMQRNRREFHYRDSYRGSGHYLCSPALLALAHQSKDRRALIAVRYQRVAAAAVLAGGLFRIAVDEGAVVHCVMQAADLVLDLE